MRLFVRTPEEAVADVATWTARLEGIVGGASRPELEHLAAEVELFNLALEAVERAVLRRREERQEEESRALALALKGDTARDSKGSRLAPGAPGEPLTHTGPHPGGHYATAR